MTNGESVVGDRDDQSRLDPHGSLRQSPPPVNNALIPTGATLSPPDSSHNSSDEEDNTNRVRGRALENLAELQAAIRIIELRKEGSPTRADEEAEKARINDAIKDLQHSQSTSIHLHTSLDSPRLPLSREARKITHSRSSTDSNIVLDLSHHTQSPMKYRRDSDEEEEEEDSDGTGFRSKPPMVRKKSGELVRPALRPSSTKRRPSSMPGTPTYSKAVHFDSHLEHVRHFLQVDKPLAVSAGSSPVEAYESEIEFPFSTDDGSRPRGPPFEWEIRVSNFPAETEDRKTMPVRVERVFLSSDNKNLIGAVAVQNLAFGKQVTTRFTLDYWKTTSEVVADFNNDVRRKQVNDGCDRFSFSIKLSDISNLENKTMFFCIRYNVNGQEYWDNNNSVNYQVDFTKKARPQHGKNGMHGAGARTLNALPRSRPSPPATSGSRPKSQPAFDDFATGFDSYGSFNHQSPNSIVGDSPIRLKTPRARADFLSDAPTRRTKQNGQAFGNRYDFGASLNAAIQNASAILGDQSGFSQKPDIKQSSREVPASAQKAVIIPPPKPRAAVKAPSNGAVPHGRVNGASSRTTPSTILSDKPSLSSQSYQELVDKYCFFGSSKSSPQLTKSTLGLVDGANDSASVSDVSVGSVRSDGSSTHTPPRSSSPSPILLGENSTKASTPNLSRSSSPIPRAGSGLGSRTASPVSFGYPYHQSSHNGFFSDAHGPTPIPG